MGDTLPPPGGGMPWKECHIMDERLRFVARLLEGSKDLFSGANCFAKVALGESTTRCGLQVLLKANRSLFSWELDDHDERPRTVLNGMTGRTVVVPIKTIIDVLSGANIVTSGICMAANNVN